MSVGIQVVTNLIKVVTDLIRGKVFSRIIDEMKRVNLANPKPSTGETKAEYNSRKRHIVIEDCKIVFTDLVEPLAESTIRLLIEVGMIYIKGR